MPFSGEMSQYGVLFHREKKTSTRHQLAVQAFVDQTTDRWGPSCPLAWRNVWLAAPWWSPWKYHRGHWQIGVDPYWIFLLFPVFWLYLVIVFDYGGETLDNLRILDEVGM